jgi:4-amino-4-deoxy-L-arabinose transferase-like glycosyltransferase
MSAAPGSTAAGRSGTDLRWLRLLIPLLLCGASFAVFATAAHRHPIGTYWTETDFYHLYLPDAKRIAAGQFPENPYQGPGFPALVAIVTKVTGDWFVAGKWISVVCATLVVALSFFLFSRLFGFWAGVAAAALVPVSAQFVQFAISATTDILFLFLALASLVALLDEKLPRSLRVSTAGVVAGLAYLVRYNGLFLVMTALIGILLLNLFEEAWRGRIKASVLFLALFIATTSPWLVVNYRYRGSPIYNTNYLNMATEFYPELVDWKTNQDGTRTLESVFRSFSDVLRYDPVRILRHYPANLYASLRDSLSTDLVATLTGWFALVGAGLFISEKRKKAGLTVLIATGLYLLLMALNHWETRYYFFVMVVYCGFAAYALRVLFHLLRKHLPMVPRMVVVLPLALFAGMWVRSLAMARSDISVFLANHPMEVVAACDYLRAQGVHGARIVARKPHLAAICDQEWVFFPAAKSLDELRAWLMENKADYVVVSSVEVKRRKELAALRSPETAPYWLEAVWETKDPLLILYQVRMNP